MRKLLIILFLLIFSFAIKAQQVVTVQNQSFVYGSSDTQGYNAQQTVPTTFTFMNNSLQSATINMYMLQAGTDNDVDNGTYDMLDGEVITGNKFTWVGTVVDNQLVHGCMVHNNINALVKYNYFDNMPSGIICKSLGNTYTSNGWAYNVFQGDALVCCYLLGINNVPIYNNTFYNTSPTFTNNLVRGTWRGIVHVYYNSQNNMNPGYPATNIKIKNNIFYTKYQIYNIVVNGSDYYNGASPSGCLTGFESDYNIFYCEAGTPLFEYLGVQKTFSQWQALGYDTHSVVVNPNFNNTTDLVPSNRQSINYGTDLGSTWNTGLSTSAVWTVNSAPATSVQNGTWQVGARVYAAIGVTTPTVTTTAITSITSTTAMSGGTVTQDGGAAIIYRGVCWKTSSGPTNVNSHTTDGTGTGSFTSSITGLTNGVTYYVRAYATNSAGTAYGAEASFTTTSSSSPTYYVAATGGSDSNAGTISNPWATIDYGVNHIAAGNILYVRGGTYTPTGYVSNGNQCAVAVSGKNGTSVNYYQVYAYPGETPIMDCTNLTSTSYNRIGIGIFGSSYWHIKGIEVKNCNQLSTGSHWGGQGVYIESSNHINIEQCNSHNNGGPGMGVRVPSGDECNFLNCDSHDNYNPYGSQGDDADGFDVGFCSNDYVIRLTGCRSWNNSSDGFDMFQEQGYSGIYILTNCWAWHQGYALDETTPVGGGGNGFKFGADPQNYTGVTKRTAINCVSYNNRMVGFSQQSADVKMILYHNVSYLNGIQGYEFQYFACADILKNNISFNNGSNDIFQTSTQTADHNSWNGHTVTKDDFTSISSSSLTASRQADGSLPVIGFLHLASTSGLIGTGVAITGQTLDGDKQLWNSPPSIGAFEYNPKGAVLVTGISVSGASNATTITTNGGTLQMSALITPSDATIQVVTWSVINGTGTGTISSSGLLQATGNGTVTVRASATDGSGVYGDRVITISNQSTVILTQDITINSAGSATTIVTNGGTLQFFVTAVVPTNATDQTVNWSVVAGTGTASISSSGLLTASGNGTVTVWAYAHDGSGAYDFKQITISNQGATVVLTSDITINSAGGVTTITTNGGTLQFSVTAYTPANATDHTATWSVVNGTGSGTISSGGLLTAVTNGTVTVWGYAHDGSGAYDFKLITISNQIIPPTVGIKVFKMYGKIVTINGKIAATQ